MLRRTIPLVLTSLSGFLSFTAALWSQSPPDLLARATMFQEKAGSRGIYDPRPALLRVILVVHLPAEADLEIDGATTQQRGEERRFVSPPLELGKTFTYTLKATWREGDQEIVRQRRVEVHAGEEAVIDMRQEQRPGR